MKILINIDVPDLQRGTDFYTRAFGLVVARRFSGFAELTGAASPIFLIQQADGTFGAADNRRTYDRHWCPVHLDFVVDDVEVAIERAVAAGAVLEGPSRREAWGTIANLADPFGHGICLVRFSPEGYDVLQSD